MSEQLTVNTLKPVYNLVELELDDYEEIELVLDTIHDLKLFFETFTNCTCRRTPKQRDLRTCFEKVGFKCFFERHFELKALEEHELELFIKLQLLSFEITDEKSDNKTFKKYTYKFNYNNSLPLCKLAYLKLCGINSYLLYTLQSYLQLNRLTNMFMEILDQFLIQYGTINRFPSPLRYQDDSEIGKVYASKKSGGEEISFQLLHDNTFNKNGKLDTISMVQLSDDHKKYLYTRIRQHIDDPYKDILCPQP
ncbi:13757_t:CDS:2 [Dentiscutata heterogama]|uniref:13757_t:CDS:1 n=1 Tax=Dentiscutata heterogama TaxID=1316150 RepID=A0ACA9L6M5_9GLOM|nr:13757_t:CDS:2 [Dentiscutata heterogama]